MSGRLLRAQLDDDDDPMASATNLVDVFLVVIAALLGALAAGVAASAEGTITVIERAGRPDMELVIRENGREVRYRGEGHAEGGQGVRAGTAWRLQDGTVIYLPEPAREPAPDVRR